MDNYEQLVKKFNELVEKINQYEIIVQEQKNNTQNKLIQLQKLFEEQQIAFKLLETNINHYEVKFKESFEKIVDVLNEKLIFGINKLNQDKLDEIKSVVHPLSEIYASTNELLIRINDTDIILDKKMEKISLIESKTTQIVEILARSLLKPDSSVINDELLDSKRKSRNDLIQLVINTKTSTVEVVKVTRIIQNFLNEIEHIQDKNELMKIYQKAVLEIQIALMDKNKR